MNAEPTISVRDDADGERYEIRVDGELAGHIEYRAAPGEIALVHTEVDDRFEGRGLAGKLTAFVRGYIQRHREYEDLVPAERRAQFDL